jgi:spermidine/putrescine transport system ATP-binding protein
VTALEDVSLTISEGELVTLLGPSGCGKTTLLRIVAGFIRPSEGRMLLQGHDVTRVPPPKRPVTMVFQRAALFPHLDVFENVAFGLRIRGTSKGDVRTRVTEALRLVRLVGFDRRRAHELSGGQLQRVALARALVNRPRVLLLDEPLAALDLRIRLEMEAELRRVHRETGATFVYVTHDQATARPSTLPGCGSSPPARARYRQVRAGSLCAQRSSASEPSPRMGCEAWSAMSPSEGPASPANSTSRAFPSR